MTGNISRRPVPPSTCPKRFAGGEVVAAARYRVDVSAYPRRHVIVVRPAGNRQTFSVHEVPIICEVAARQWARPLIRRRWLG